MNELKYENELIMLKKFKNNIASKRLLNDITDLRNICSSVYVSYNEGFDKLSIFVHDKEEGKKENIFEFIINENYPFREPNLIINCQPYKRYLILNEKSLKILNKKFGIKCLYDNSYINNNNWSPAITFNNIIIELRKNIEIKDKINKNQEHNHDDIKCIFQKYK